MDVMYMICFFLIGAVLGSFYNVLGIRIPRHESIVKHDSHCEKCGHLLKWYELIPIISFLALRGKCSSCKAKISLMYPFSELVCGILFALSFYSYGFSIELLISLVISSLLIVVIVSDLNYMIIPDRFIVISSILIIIFKIIGYGIEDTLYSILSGIVSFGVMFLIMKFGSYVFKKEAMGGADVKLMFIVGLCTEPFLALIVIIVASVLALPPALFLLYKEKERIIPFGPFIVIGLLIVLFTKINSQEIINFLIKK